jgi:pimeloyl-ACP methyl ester carboxylesterase
VQPLTHKRAKVSDVTLQYVTAGDGPVVLRMHGWHQNHREFLTVIERLENRYRFIAPDLPGFADSDKPYTNYDPLTLAGDMIGLLKAEGVDDDFHILSHDLGGPAAVALAYTAST